MCVFYDTAETCHSKSDYYDRQCKLRHSKSHFFNDFSILPFSFPFNMEFVY